MLLATTAPLTMSADVPQGGGGGDAFPLWKQLAKSVGYISKGDLKEVLREKLQRVNLSVALN